MWADISTISTIWLNADIVFIANQFQATAFLSKPHILNVFRSGHKSWMFITEAVSVIYIKNLNSCHLSDPPPPNLMQLYPFLAQPAFRTSWSMGHVINDHDFDTNGWFVLKRCSMEGCPGRQVLQQWRLQTGERLLPTLHPAPTFRKQTPDFGKGDKMDLNKNVEYNPISQHFKINIPPPCWLWDNVFTVHWIKAFLGKPPVGPYCASQILSNPIYPSYQQCTHIWYDFKVRYLGTLHHGGRMWRRQEHQHWPTRLPLSFAKLSTRSHLIIRLIIVIGRAFFPGWQLWTEAQSRKGRRRVAEVGEFISSRICCWDTKRWRPGFTRTYMLGHSW